MSEERSLASTIYPDLPSGSAPAPAPERTPSADDRSAGEKIYGSEPADGLAQAKAGIEAGKAKPASEVAAESEAAPAAEVGEYGLARGPLLDQFTALTKEAGLSRESAAKMAALHKEALSDASTQYWEQTGQAWERQTRQAFPGAQLDAAVGPVKALLADRSLTTPGFMRLLSDYRLGNNPDIVRTLANWAKAISRRR